MRAPADRVPAENAPARRGPARRWLTVLIVGLELIFGAVWLGAVAVVWAVTTPEILQQIVDRATEQAKFDVRLQDVEVLPTSRLLAPWTWKLAVIDLRIEPHQDHAPVITVGRAHLGMPYLSTLVSEHRVQLRTARIIGLRIEARQQQPGPDWEAKQPALEAVGADLVEVWGASWWAPEDPPLKEGHAEAIFGELHDVVYELGPRLLSASGRLRVRRFRSGSLEVEHIVLPAVNVKDSTLGLDGRFAFAGARGRIRGEIRDFTRRASSRLEVELTGAQLADAVERATGHTSPLTGKLDAYLIVHSGGEIPRGHGWMEGSARLTDGRIPLGEEIKPFIKDLIRLAPYLTLNDRDEVQLGDMNGKMQVRRGAIILRELLYEAPRRHIQFRGEIVGPDKNLVIRFMPARDPDERAGFGVVLAGREKLKFRIAGKHDLLPSVYPPDDADEVVAEAGRKRRRR